VTAVLAGARFRKPPSRTCGQARRIV